MAKVIGPGFGLEAYGSVGSAITYQRRPSGTAFFKRTVPKDVKSESQLNIRAFMSEAVSFWQGLTPTEKELWNDEVK